MGDGKHQDLIGLVVNPKNDTPVPDAIAQQAGELVGQAFDIVVSAWLAFQLRKTAGELSGQRPVSSCEESLGLRRKDDLKHLSGPCANSDPGPLREPFPPRLAVGSMMVGSENAHNRQAIPAFPAGVGAWPFYFRDASATM